MPLIKRNGSQEDLNLKDLNLGKPHISALSSSVKGLKLKNVILSGIKNNEDGISDMLQNLPKEVQNLDVSNSSIGFKSIENLYGWLKKGFRQGHINLKNLDLSNNKISDELGEKFVRKLI